MKCPVTVCMLRVVVLLSVMVGVSAGHGHCLPVKRGSPNIAGGAFITFKLIEFQQCMKECLLRQHCSAVSFDSHELKCKLGHSLGSTNFESHMVSYLKSDLLHLVGPQFLGPCANHSCKSGERCVVLSSGNTVCMVTECGEYGPDIYQYFNEQSRVVGKTLEHACTRGYMIPGTFKIRCLASGNWSQSNCTPCPQNYTSLTAVNFCHKISKESKNFTDSRKSCEDEGSSLVKISSQRKLDQLVAIIQEHGATEFFVDGTDGDRDGEYTLSDGMPVMFNLTQTTQTQETGACLMLSKNEARVLTVAACNDVMLYICEVTAS